jgi:branched-chain amino acid transport system substrate-binding protein
MALIAAAVAAIAAAGCGSGEGVAEGARLTIYVSAPLHGGRAAEGRRLCAEAQRELRSHPRAGDARLRAVCLDDTGPGGRWRAARVGANARRALEDSSTVAYIGEPEPAAARFSAPILESAGIAQLTGESGGRAARKVAAAIRAGGSGSPREAVLEALR